MIKDFFTTALCEYIRDSAVPVTANMACARYPEKAKKIVTSTLAKLKRRGHLISRFDGGKFQYSFVSMPEPVQRPTLKQVAIREEAGKPKNAAPPRMFAEFVPLTRDSHNLRENWENSLRDPMASSRAAAARAIR